MSVTVTTDGEMIHMAVEIQQFQPRRIVRQINKRLAKGETLDAILKDIAPDYGVTPEALYQRLRLHGGRMQKRMVLPELTP